MKTARTAFAWRMPTWTPAVLAAGLVLLSRWSVVRYPHELNADEGQMLAQAMRYRFDAMPWRAVDGTTSGPFNSWFLLLAPADGASLSYSAAHLLAALSWALTIAFLFFAAARFWGKLPAAIAAFAGAVWLAVNQNADFVHYSSETLPVLLIAAAIAAAAGGAARPAALARTSSEARQGRPAPPVPCHLSPVSWHSALAALLLGIVPWAKLQAAPIAAVIGIWILFNAFKQQMPVLPNAEDAEGTEDRAASARRCTRAMQRGDHLSSHGTWLLIRQNKCAMSANQWLPLSRLCDLCVLCGKNLIRFQLTTIIACALFPTMIIVAAVWRAGALDEMWESYFVANTQYAGSLLSADYWTHAGAMLLSWPIFPWMALLALLALVVRPLSPVSRPLSPVPCLPSTVPRPPSPVSRPQSPVPCPPSPVLVVRPLSPVPRLLSPVSRPPSPAIRLPLSATRFTIVLTLVSLAACLRPEIRLQHHQLLMFPALVLLTAATIARLAPRTLSPVSGPLSPVPAGFSLARIRLGAAIVLAAYVGIRLPDLLATSRQRTEMMARQTSASLVLQRAHALSPEFHSIAVWGWFPSIYVESGLTPPTRDVITQFLVSNLPGQDERRADFLADFTAAEPDVLVDSSARGMERMFGVSAGIEDFPALAQLVHADYRNAGSVETPSGPVRIFVRKRAEHPPLGIG